MKPAGDYLSLCIKEGDLFGIGLALEAAVGHDRLDEVRALAKAEQSRLAGYLTRFGMPSKGCSELHVVDSDIGWMAHLISVTSFGRLRVVSQAIEIGSSKNYDCPAVLAPLQSHIPLLALTLKLYFADFEQTLNEYLTSKVQTDDIGGLKSALVTAEKVRCPFAVLEQFKAKLDEMQRYELVPVIFCGATGHHAPLINGIYVPLALKVNGKPVFAKKGSSQHLFFATDGIWRFTFNLKSAFFPSSVSDLRNADWKLFRGDWGQPRVTLSEHGAEPATEMLKVIEHRERHIQCIMQFSIFYSKFLFVLRDWLRFDSLGAFVLAEPRDSPIRCSPLNGKSL